MPDMDLRAGLAAVRCPVLVMVGEQDPLVPPSNAQEAVLAIPDGLATLHRVATPGIRCSGTPPASSRSCSTPSSTAARI